MRSTKQHPLNTELDGGGCMEAAEAMTEIRRNHGHDTGTESGSVDGGEGLERSRRTFLSAVTGIAALGVAGAAAAAEQEPEDVEGEEELDVPDVTVYRVTGRGRWVVARTVLRKPEVRKLGREMNREGYPLKVKDAVVTYTEIGDPVEETVVSAFIPGRSPDGESVTLVWSTSNEIETHVLRSEHVDTSGDGENDHWNLTSYTVEGGDVVTRTEVVENFGGCSNVHWPCVAEIAATYFAMFGSCALCAGSLTPPTCALCLSSVGWHLAAQHCPWCRD